MAGLPGPSAHPSQHWAPAPALLLWWVLLPTKAEAAFANKNVHTCRKQVANKSVCTWREWNCLGPWPCL